MNFERPTGLTGPTGTTPAIMVMAGPDDCNICFVPNRPMTDPSDICMHYNRICKDCKRTLYELEKQECPYCKISWQELYKNEFYNDKIIATFKEGLSSLYMCLTDEEANTKCRETLKDQLHEVEYSIISEFFKEGCDIPEDIYGKFVNIMNEDANPILEALITSTDALCDAVIGLNGRGSILADDGIEIPVSICNKSLFLYASE